MALDEMGYDNLAGIVVNMINMYRYKKGIQSQPLTKLFKRDSEHRTPTELINTGKNVDRIVDKMIQARHDWETQQIMPVRNMKRDCKRCDMADACIADFKGYDMKSQLGLTYRIKGSK